jgi:hypothetical protein
MNLSLLAPLGLAALVALALPILIHLVRRIELTTTEFAALRWISERAQPRRRIRFERPWLLLLRLVLLALLALLLARPVFDAPTQAQASRVFVAPGADPAAARAAIDATGADWRWLAPGFPRMAEMPAPAAVPLASLLREADAELPAGATLRVVVPAEVAGLDGERPQLVHAPDWHVVPGRMRAGDSPPAEGGTLAVRYAPDAQDSLVWLRAAVAAWNVREPGRYRLDAQPLTVPLGDDARWLAWLAPSPPAAVSAWIERGGVALLSGDAQPDGDPLWRDADGHVLARSRSSGRGRIIALPAALTPAALPLLLEADFPQRLLGALHGASPAPQRAVAAALEPVRLEHAGTTTSAASGGSHPVDPWLALAAAALFFAERVLATRMRADANA